MACSTVLRNNLQDKDIITWFGTYQGHEPWLKFMLNKCSRYEDVVSPPSTETVVFGVLRNGLFHYVEN